jgi:ribosomal-protein-serine acetyltransferase
MKTALNPILFNLPIPITTPRLILRPPKIGDGGAVNEAIQESFDILNRFMPWASQKVSVEESEIFARQAAANWILKNNDEPYLPLFMFDKQTNQFIGGTGYHHYDWDIPSIETGYWIRTSRSGQGLMREAINALTQYAFRQLGVKRMAITCDVNNIRSKKVPESLNYHLESIAKSNRVNPDGKIGDTCIYVRYNLNNLPSLDITW